MMQPGMDRLMAEVGQRCHRLYYAAKAGNWKLAEYFYNSTVKQLKLCATSRPKYAEDMAAYLDEDCAPLREALRNRDPEGVRLDVRPRSSTARTTTTTSGRSRGFTG